MTIKNWLNFIENPEKITSIFLDTIPSLDGIDLHEIILSKNSNSVSLRFDLSVYPLMPPKKWQLSGYNRVQIQLDLGTIQTLKIEGWAYECKCDLLIKKEANLIKLKGGNGSTKIEIVCETAYVQNISAYLIGA